MRRERVRRVCQACERCVRRLMRNRVTMEKHYDAATCRARAEGRLSVREH